MESNAQTLPQTNLTGDNFAQRQIRGTSGSFAGKGRVEEWATLVRITRRYHFRSCWSTISIAFAPERALPRDATMAAFDHMAQNSFTAGEVVHE
jgi:hypothetical protein